MLVKRQVRKAMRESINAKARQLLRKPSETESAGLLVNSGQDELLSLRHLMYDAGASRAEGKVGWTSSQHNDDARPRKAASSVLDFLQEFRYDASPHGARQLLSTGLCHPRTPACQTVALPPPTHAPADGTSMLAANTEVQAGILGGVRQHSPKVSCFFKATRSRPLQWQVSAPLSAVDLAGEEHDKATLTKSTWWTACALNLSAAPAPVAMLTAVGRKPRALRSRFFAAASRDSPNVRDATASSV